MSKAKNPTVAAAWITGGLGCTAAIVAAIISLIAVIIQVTAPDPTIAASTNPPPDTQLTTQSETTLTVINNTSDDICYLYIVSADSTTWGLGKLDAGQTIPSNKAQSFDLETGMYNLRAENCRKEPLQEILNSHIQGTIYWTVEHMDPPPSNTVLEVINNTPEDICYLYIGPSDSESWGENWLTEIDKIPVGGKSTFSMETGMYNLKAENCARETIAETHDNHLQGPMEWDLK